MMINHEHGTRNRYKNGCRCDPCRQAASAYRKQHPAKATPGRTTRVMAELRARFARTGEVPGGRHGTTYAYNVGCRCRPCRHAISAYRAGWRRGEPSSEAQRYRWGGAQQGFDSRVLVAVVHQEVAR